MYRATQDRQVIVVCSDKTGEGSGKPLLYYCLEKPMNNTKRQTDMTLKNELTMWVQFSSIQPLSCIRLFATPWTAARQASLSNINSQSLLKLISIEPVMPSNHLILCCPLLLQPSIFPRIKVFSSELVLCIRWPKYWSFSFSISPSYEHPGLISFRMDWLDLLAVQGTSPTPQFKSINSRGEHRQNTF